MLHRGTYSTLDEPQAGVRWGIGTRAAAINAHGDIVGNYDDATDINTLRQSHGFLWHQGRFTTIDHPNAIPEFGTWLSDINDQGDIVGSYVGNDNVRRGFLLRDGQYRTVEPVETVHGTVARGINNHGDIVGSYIGSDGVSHGFLLRRGTGTYTALDHSRLRLPYGRGTKPAAINERGEIVGTYIEGQEVYYGFLWR